MGKYLAHSKHVTNVCDSDDNDGSCDGYDNDSDVFHLNKLVLYLCLFGNCGKGKWNHYVLSTVTFIKFFDLIYSGHFY